MSDDTKPTRELPVPDGDLADNLIALMKPMAYALGEIQALSEGASKLDPREQARLLDLIYGIATRERVRSERSCLGRHGTTS